MNGREPRDEYSVSNALNDAQGTGKAIQLGSYTYEVDELQAARPNHAHLKVKIINKINVPKCSRLCEKTCLATQLYRSANPEHRTVFKDTIAFVSLRKRTQGSNEKALKEKVRET